MGGRRGGGVRDWDTSRGFRPCGGLGRCLAGNTPPRLELSEPTAVLASDNAMVAYTGSSEIKQFGSRLLELIYYLSRSTCIKSGHHLNWGSAAGGASSS